jgi:dynein heavy chain 2
VLASSAGGAGGAPSWVAEDRASMVGQLVAALPAVAQSLDLHNGNKWGKWAATERCEAEWPSGLPQDVTAFQKILLVHAARPERLQSALVEFVTATLGIPSLSPSSSSLGQIHENDSSAVRQGRVPDAGRLTRTAP